MTAMDCGYTLSAVILGVIMMGKGIGLLSREKMELRTKMYRAMDAGSPEQIIDCLLDVGVRHGIEPLDLLVVMSKQAHTMEAIRVKDLARYKAEHNISLAG